MNYDVVIIGAGLAGLTAALKALKQGLKTIVLTRGASTLQVMSGCIDLYGAEKDPWPGIRALAQENPGHPYALLGEEDIYQALSFFIQEVKETCPYHYQEGFLNFRIPTALGQMRTTCLLPEGQVAAADADERVLVVGFKGYRDFCSGLMAEGMNKKGCSWRSLDVDLSRLQGSGASIAGKSAVARSYQNSIELAVRLESRWQQLAEELRLKVQGFAKVAFPAVLGLDRHLQVQQGLEESLGKRVFEVPTLQPSLPGVRLFRCLMGMIRDLGGDLLQGAAVVASEKTGGLCSKVLVKTAGKTREIKGKCYILATGGMGSRGIALQRNGFLETVFGLPTAPAEGPGAGQQYPAVPNPGTEYSKAGVLVNKQLQPLDTDGKTLLENVFCAGRVLAGYDPFSEGSGAGVAIATGYKAAVLVGRGVKGD